MPSETATWEIPYPDGTDTFCDGYLYIQQMAERVDEILDEFDVDIEAAEVVPLARVSRSTSQTIYTGGVSSTLVYEQVDFDTAGLADQYLFGTLTVADDIYYLAGATTTWQNTPASAGSAYTLQIEWESSGDIFTYAQRDSSVAAIAAIAGMDRNTNGLDEQIELTPILSNGAATSMTAGATFFWVLKIGDV